MIHVEKLSSKIFLLLGLLVLMQVPHSFALIEDCGVYEFSGRFLEDKNKLVNLSINKGTMSEYFLKLNSKSHIEALGLVDTAVEGRVRIMKSTNSYRAEGVEVMEVKLRVPNPLAKGDQFLRIVSKEKCPIE